MNANPRPLEPTLPLNKRRQIPPLDKGVYAVLRSYACIGRQLWQKRCGASAAWSTRSGRRLAETCLGVRATDPELLKKRRVHLGVCRLGPQTLRDSPGLKRAWLNRPRQPSLRSNILCPLRNMQFCLLDRSRNWHIRLPCSRRTVPEYCFVSADIVGNSHFAK